jgi:hypothetical protein
MAMTQLTYFQRFRIEISRREAFPSLLSQSPEALFRPAKTLCPLKGQAIAVLPGRADLKLLTALKRLTLLTECLTARPRDKRPSHLPSTPQSSPFRPLTKTFGGCLLYAGIFNLLAPY